LIIIPFTHSLSCYNTDSSVKRTGSLQRLSAVRVCKAVVPC